MFPRPWICLLPAFGLSVAWWSVAASVIASRGGLSQPQALVLAVVVGLQVTSHVISLAACQRARAKRWECGVILGLALLAGNALYFFTPALGVPLLLAATAGATIVLVTSRAEPEAPVDI